MITVSTTCFHRVWVSLPWSYPHPVGHFSQRRWDAPPQERRLSYILCDPRINVLSKLKEPSSYLPLRPTERCTLSTTPPLNCLSRHNLRLSSSTRLQPVVVEGPDWAETLPVNCWEIEFRRCLRCSLVKISDDDARKSAHSQREGCGFQIILIWGQTAFDSSVDILLWRLPEYGSLCSHHGGS